MTMGNCIGTECCFGSNKQKTRAAIFPMGLEELIYHPNQLACHGNPACAGVFRLLSNGRPRLFIAPAVQKMANKGSSCSAKVRLVLKRQQLEELVLRIESEKEQCHDAIKVLKWSPSLVTIPEFDCL